MKSSSRASVRPALAAGTAEFLDDALRGLLGRPKRLPSKYFYDARGSALFDRICRLPEYYPTRTELSILRRHGAEIAAAAGPRRQVVEPGCGSSVKPRRLLAILDSPVAFVPMDISPEALANAADRIARRFPEIAVTPVHGDFLGDFDPPAPPPDAAGRLVFFPGSTIGNFEPPAARRLLRRLAEIAGPGGLLLLGYDRKKDVRVLLSAYDDAAGVTAEFDRNLLVRLRKELGARVPIGDFDHRATWNRREGRIEMHLVNRTGRPILLAGREIRFRPGESIHTENSYKYSPEEFAAMAAGAGLAPVARWTDPKEWFDVALFRA